MKYLNMKMNSWITELILSLILIIVLIVCLNPFGLLMPPPMVMALILFLVIIFGVFSIFIWKERRGDERENYHKIISGHFAFLTGSTLLIIAIAYQELNHELDPWLVLILIGMVLAKLLSQFYSNKKL